MVVGLLYVAVFSQFIVDSINEISELMSSTYGVPYYIIRDQLSQIISVVNFIAPIAYVIQYSLIGALLGLLQNYLMLRLKTGLLTSIVLTGVIYVVVFGVMLLLVAVALRDPLLTLVLRKLGSLIYAYLVMSGILFTLFLSIVHLVRGPWRGILEAKPKEF